MLGNILQFCEEMMIKGYLSILFFVLQMVIYAMSSFEEAMEEGYTPQTYRNAKRFKEAYENWHFEKIDQATQPIIPKIIHQIWIGGDVPEKFKPLMQTWMDKHPDWDYKLWTDEDIELFAFENLEAFEYAQNLGAKSDIWRYEILKQYGGVYVDIDFECVSPLTPLVYSHKFFAGIGGFDYINNAIIGSISNHPILIRLMTILKSTSKENLNNPWHHTGPLLFTKQIYSYLKNHPEEGIVYPVRFFYPLPNTYRHAYWRGELSQEEIHRFFIPETFGVHYWAESWVH